MRQYKTGSVIYHESRYWKTDNLAAGEVPGWNARYLPYVVTRVTDARIYATGAGPDLQTSHVQFPRRKRPDRGHWPTLEADGKQYHSRFHEYFYAEVPTIKVPSYITGSRLSKSLYLLGITPPYSAEDVARAYKRKARTMHPDAGGSHEEFIRLQAARDVALRGY